MWLGGRYKRLCKLLFVLQLVISWAVVLCATLSSASQQGTSAASGAAALREAVFGLAIAVSVLLSLDGVLTPKARWRQLRSSAGALESAIWCYRTRVGPFGLAESRRDANLPETNLCTCLNEWRDNLMAAASLKSTNIQREYRAATYRHFQDHGEPADGADDFQSPTQPERYLELRIAPAIRFYSLRIPKYTRASLLLKMSVLLLGVAASVLARYEHLSLVTVTTAAATAFTSWAEFSDAQRKVERYSSAVVALKKLLSWWRALGDVQKASKDSIETLVRSAEEIISHERTSWMSVAGRQPAKDEEATDAESGANKRSNSRRMRVVPSDGEPASG